MKRKIISYWLACVSLFAILVFVFFCAVGERGASYGCWRISGPWLGYSFRSETGKIDSICVSANDMKAIMSAIRSTFASAPGSSRPEKLITTDAVRLLSSDGREVLISGKYLYVDGGWRRADDVNAIMQSIVNCILNKQPQLKPTTYIMYSSYFPESVKKRVMEDEAGRILRSVREK